MALVNTGIEEPDVRAPGIAPQPPGQRTPLSESDLRNLVEAEIQNAVTYDDTELSNERVRAIDYDNGWMPDVPPEEGRSQVVSYDVRDTIDWIMPGLMRIFTSTDEIVCYQPSRPGQEEAAAQASDYVNHVFLNECQGANILFDAMRDGLLLRNGYIKYWWDTKPDYQYHTLYSLTEDAIALLMQDPDVEVIGISQDGGMPPLPMEEWRPDMGEMDDGLEGGPDGY